MHISTRVSVTVTGCLGRKLQIIVFRVHQILKVYVGC